MSLSIHAVDLFCGAGGLTHGLEKTGICVKLGVDKEETCQYPYATNNASNFLWQDVHNIEAEDLQEAYQGADIRLLVGCAPCQTFSSYARKVDYNDERWWLLRQFSRIVKEVGPDVVAIENVHGLAKQGVFLEFIEDLRKEGYHIDRAIVDSSLYGSPQKRKRLIVLASKLGPIRLLTPAEFNRPARVVKDAIGHLPPIEDGECDPNDPLHRCSQLTELNRQRIRASRPGGTWRDWPLHLVVGCHQKSSGRKYSGSYGRLRWDQPCPTITTQFYGIGNGRNGHPEQHRALSLREGALLQGFPQSYEFVPPGEPVSITAVGRFIGNAVPVELGEVIGQSVIRHVEGKREVNDGAI